jgi:hypothetical protein
MLRVAGTAGWTSFNSGEWYVEKNPVHGQLWDLQVDENCRDIDTSPLYLPREGVAELAFQKNSAKRLALAYRPLGGGEWVMNENLTSENFIQGAAGSRVANQDAVVARDNEEVVGIQLYQRPLRAVPSDAIPRGYYDDASVRGGSGLGIGIRLLVVPKS